MVTGCERVGSSAWRTALKVLLVVEMRLDAILQLTILVASAGLLASALELLLLLLLRAA